MKLFRIMAMTVFVTISSFMAVVYTACDKDKCASLVCKNGGWCTGGTCSCLRGFYGTTCDSSWVSNVIGTYIDSSVCIPFDTLRGFTSTITSPGLDSIYISNFANTGYTVKGLVNGVTHTIEIPTQTVHHNVIISDTGYYANGVIHMHYTKQSGIDTVTNYTCDMDMYH